MLIEPSNNVMSLSTNVMSPSNNVNASHIKTKLPVSNNSRKRKGIEAKKNDFSKTSRRSFTLAQDQNNDTVASYSFEDIIVLHPLLEVLKTPKYERLNIKSDQESIFVDIQGYMFNVISKDDKNKFDEDAMKFVDNYVIFKDTEASLLEKDETWRGAYLVVNNADDKYLHETEGSALRGKEGKHSFVGRIGYNEKSAEVLALGQHEKPTNFDRFDMRETFPTFQQCKGLYHSRTRRWLEVSLQLTGGGGFRKEYFLLDTGSPKSIIIEELVANLRVKRNYDNSPIIEIEGEETLFEVQPRSVVPVEEPSERTRNINLLGTNFLNQFVIMDDFCSKTILVLKRASPPPTRV